MNILEFLESASSEIIKSSTRPITSAFHESLLKIKKELPNYRKSKDSQLIYSVITYKFIRFLQEIDARNMSIFFTNRKEDTLLQIASSNLREILKTLYDEQKIICSRCGREFLRFGLDKQIVSDYSIDFNIKNYFTKPEKEFVHLIIPESIRKLLEKIISSTNPITVDEATKQIFTNSNPHPSHLLVSDCIRFVFADSHFASVRIDIINSIISHSPKPSQTPNLFEVCLSLAIDILSVPPDCPNEKHDSVKSFLSLLPTYPSLIGFIERISSDSTEMKRSISDALFYTSTKNPFTNLALPKHEEEAPRVDTRSAINVALQKMKWQAKEAKKIASELTPALLQNMKLYEFEVPVSKNANFDIVMECANDQMLSELCAKSQPFMKRMMFCLVDDTKRIINVMEMMLRDHEDSGSLMFTAISKVMVIAPQILDDVFPLLRKIPKSADLSPFVRYLAYNCTCEVICMVYAEDPIFPTNTKQAAQLFKQSLMWRDLPQSMLWLIVNCVFAHGINNSAVFGAIRSVLPKIAGSKIAFANMRTLLSKVMPCPAMRMLLLELFNESDGSWIKVRISLIMNWCMIDSEKAAKYAMFQLFLACLSKEEIAKLPNELFNIENIKM